MSVAPEPPEPILWQFVRAWVIDEAVVWKEVYPGNVVSTTDKTVAVRCLLRIWRTLDLKAERGERVFPCDIALRNRSPGSVESTMSIYLKIKQVCRSTSFSILGLKPQ